MNELPITVLVIYLVTIIFCAIVHLYDYKTNNYFRLTEDLMMLIISFVILPIAIVHSFLIIELTIRLGNRKLKLNKEIGEYEL